MRILVDACIDPRVVELFAEHAIQTALDLGWHTLKDPELMRGYKGVSTCY